MNVEVRSVRKGTMLPDPDFGFDDGPTGQMTHSQPWSLTPSSSSTAVLECNADLTADDCRELAKHLTNVALVLEGKPIP
jgi:hypothetical protein